MARRIRHGLRRGLLASPVLALAVSSASARSAGDEPAPAGGGAEAASDAAPDLRALQETVERLDAENRRMRAEMDELRAQTGDRWLTEARAEEIRTLVSDVLADADVRASHLASGLTAGWNEHFFLASPDGRFKLQLDGLIQVRFGWAYKDDEDRHRYGFEVTRARLTFRGHVFNPGITYLIRTDKTRDDPSLVEGLYLVRDAWIQFQLDNNWSTRFGLFRLPFSREQLVGVGHQLAVERSLVSENTSLDRSEGVELTWASETDKVSVAFSDGGTDNLGGFNAVGGQPPNTSLLVQDSEFALTGRWEHLFAGAWKQFADFTSPPEDEFGALVGIAAHWEQSEATGLGSFQRNETRWFAATADVSLEFGGANFFAAATYHYVDAPNFRAQVIGVVAQGGVFLAPKWELFGRVEYGNWDIPSTVANFADLGLVTVGFNYYLDGHDLKWTTDLGVSIGIIDQPWDSDIAGFEAAPRDSEPTVVFRTQFQLLF